MSQPKRRKGGIGREENERLRSEIAAARKRGTRTVDIAKASKLSGSMITMFLQKKSGLGKGSAHRLQQALSRLGGSDVKKKKAGDDGRASEALRLQVRKT